MVTPEGNMIPMVPAIGNHESGGRWEYINPSEVPFYYRYFTRYGTEGAGMGSYRHIRVGHHTLLLVLDSGMAFDIGGQQADWLAGMLSYWKNMSVSEDFGPHSSPNVLALYHIPMWGTGKGDSPTELSMRQSWSPLFANYNVDVALENHSHRYGRTTMRSGQKTANGTLHIGGGSWGVPPSGNDCGLHWFFDICPSGTPWYVDKMVVTRHVLRVEVLPHEIKITAIDENGKAFDSVAKEILPKY